MMDNIYSVIQEHLNRLPPTSAGTEARTRWVADFNAMATQIEAEVEVDNTEADDQVSLPPWLARIEERDLIWLYTPPLIRKGKYVAFEAIRLCVSADEPVKDIHVNCRTVPVDDKYEINGVKQFACIIVNTNAEAIKDSPLVAIWFLWDSIARVGVKRGLENGLITETWVNNAFAHATACKGKYPSRFYQRAGAANEYLATLYRLCAARGITEAMLHGEGSGGKKGRFGLRGSSTYHNTWINMRGVCSCCPQTVEHPLRYGYGEYPYGSILGHVLSVRHRRNAAEYLLKMQQQTEVKRE